MNDRISSKDFVEVLQESFRRGHDITFTPSGTSMLPLLDGQEDRVTLSPKPDRLKKHDVALYIRPKTKQLVLHRMIGFTRSGEYIFCGDNQFSKEYGIGDDDILALMTSYTHSGQECQPKGFSYRMYLLRLAVRRNYRRFRHKAYRAYQKIIKK